MKKLLALFLLLATPAFGQGTGSLQNHAIPLGKGTSVRGFTALAPGSVANAPLLNVPNGDAFWGSVPALNLSAGTGISINVVGTTATIASTGSVTGAITSLGGMAGPSITCGTGITCVSSTVSNGGVTSLGAATGAVTLGSKLSIPGNVLTYTPDTPGCTEASTAGFVGDGTTANDTAFNNWWTSVGTSNGCLRFGVGKFLFSSAVSKTMAAARQTITIKGAGADGTVLYWTAGGGMKFTRGSSLNSINVSDLTFSTGAVNTGSGLFLDSGATTYGIAQVSSITNVAFRGDDFDDINANTKYWATGFQIKGWASINIYGIATYGLIGAPGTAGGGVGLNISGYSGVQATVINIYASSFSWQNVGAELDSNWEGVTFSQCNFQGEVGSVGLYTPSAQTNAGPLLNVSNSQFNSGGQQIDLVSAVSEVVIRGNTITVIGNSNAGILLSTGAVPIITGNLINHASGTSTIGISINAATGGIIEGNIIQNQSTGVVLNASSTNVNVSQNLYPGTTTQVSDLGTANSVGLATK